ncbi:MAG: FAD-binding oxidoreductase [Pseudomonadales bacterium]
MTIAPPDDGAVFSPATVTTVDVLAPEVRRIVLQPATPLFYHPGQFLNLRRSDGVVRSYSIASVPRLLEPIELHIERQPGGRFSSWVFESLCAGEVVDFQGPNGSCFYVPGRPDTPMLLVGTGTGLAPLIGIARDALHDGHRGPIHLYHGSRSSAGLYLRDWLSREADRHSNLHYVPCLSGKTAANGCRAGRADDNALADFPDLTDWRVYLCGYPPMVHGMREKAYLAGASLGDIYADAFELKALERGAVGELRRTG